MRRMSVIICVCLVFSACEKDPVIPVVDPFYTVVHGTGELTGRDILFSNQTGIISVAGYGDGPNADDDLFLFTFDSAGRSVAQHFFGTAGNDQCWSFVKSNDGGFVFAGWTDVNTGGLSNDVLVIKTDEDGNAIWTKIYGGAFNDLATDIVATSNGYLIAGIKGSSADENSWVLRLDENGDTLWTVEYGGNNPDGAMSVCANEDNTFAVTGYTNSSGNGSTDGFLMLVSDDGNLQGYYPFGTPEYEEPHAICRLHNGWVIAGHAGTTDLHTHNIFQQFIGTNGSIGNFITHGGDMHDGGEAMTIFRNHLYVIGRSSSQDPDQDFLYLKTDLRGNAKQLEWIGTEEENSGFGIYADDRQVLMTGFTVNTLTSRKDLLVVRK
jgi:hypothetical protein